MRCVVISSTRALTRPRSETVCPFSQAHERTLARSVRVPFSPGRSGPDPGETPSNRPRSKALTPFKARFVLLAQVNRVLNTLETEADGLGVTRTVEIVRGVQ